MSGESQKEREREGGDGQGENPQLYIETNFLSSSELERNCSILDLYQLSSAPN